MSKLGSSRDNVTKIIIYIKVFFSYLIFSLASTSLTVSRGIDQFQSIFIAPSILAFRRNTRILLSFIPHCSLTSFMRISSIDITSRMWGNHPKLETHAIEALRNYLNEMGVY